MTIKIGREGSVIGEWSEDEIQISYEAGRLKATDWYWKEGMDDWALLDTLVETTPPLAFPTGLIPVTKRRNFTASQLIPKAGTLIKAAATATGSLIRNSQALTKTKKRFPRISNPLLLNESLPENSRELVPTKTGFTALLSRLFPDKKKVEYDECRKTALEMYVMQINLGGAFLIDEVTRLNGAKWVDGAIHFRYTIFAPSAAESLKLQGTMQSFLEENYRTSSHDKVLRHYRVMTRHDFVHKSGARLFQISVGPEN